MANWIRTLGRRVGLVATPQGVTAQFSFDKAEIWDSDFISFSLDNDYVAFIRMDQIIVSDIRIELRDAARVPVVRESVFDIGTFRFSPDGKNVIIRDRDKELIKVQPIADISTFQFEDVPLDLSELEPEPEPPPPPPPPPVVNEWRVAYSLGMNIRSTPEVTTTNLLGGVPGGWVFDNAGIKATGSDFSWLQIHRGEYAGKDFAGAWIAAKKISSGFVYCVPNVVEEPAPLTVQLAGPMKLETRSNGYTYLKGGEGSGFNMRYMATGRYNPDEYLDFIAGNGFKWVRVYFSQERHTLQQNIDKFRMVLDKAAARNLLVCAVITDSLGHSGMIIEEDRPWHTGGGIGHLNIDWITSKRYRVDYHRYVHGFASTFKDHPGLGMIDIVNEAGIYGANPITLTHAKAYIDWLAESAELAYDSCDGQRPIAFGGINSLHSLPPGKPIADHAKELIMTCKHIQVWGPHFYSEKDYHPEALYRFEEDCVTYDYRFAKEAGKAIYGTEIGSWYTNNDRPLATRRVFERNRDKWNGGWYWGLGLHTDNGECDAHAMFLQRDGATEFNGMLDAMKAFHNTTPQAA